MLYCRPKRVCLDICTLCQLNCRDCYMRTRQIGAHTWPAPTVGRGYLRFEQFKKFLDDNDFVTEIELANCGEMFLNPDLEKMMQYAFEKHVKLMAWTGVNMNTVSDRVLEALVKYAFVGLNVSIDGASDDVYCLYRRGGHFTTVINNIKKVLEYKKKYQATLPIIHWNYIVMDCTQDIREIRQAKKMAAELGIDILFRKTYVDTFVPDDPEAIERETGLVYRNVDLDNVAKRFNYAFPSTYCIQSFTMPRINWDGRLFGCCCNNDGWNINVFEMGLEKALSLPEVQYARQMLMNRVPVRPGGPCATCFELQRMIRDNIFVSDAEIQKFACSD